MTDTQLANVSDFLKQNARTGLETVKTEDLPIPRLVVVQGVSKGAVTSDGKRAPVGTLYYEGTREAMDKVECAFVSAEKKQIYSTDPNATPGTMVDAWVFIGVRDSDKKPFEFSCRKGQMIQAGAFISRVISKGVPLFSVKVTLETKEIDGEKGAFFIPVFRDGEVRNDITELQMLKKLTDMYKGSQSQVAEIPTISEEERQKIKDFSQPAPAQTPAQAQPVPPAASAPVTVSPDEIPF